ncbi:MAG TPA: polymer-forming cytoskeletal protein [Longimicrobiales bacterium]|nr:polymer-forming cytoskeletal protein [Longimicrobiales bacterium]
MRTKTAPWLMAVVAGTLAVQPLAGQETIREREIPPDLAIDVLMLVNDPGTLRLEGDATIPRDRVVQGPLAMVGGTLTLEGRVEGDVVVLNGGLVLGADAAIGGDVLLVGGDLAPESRDRIAGSVVVYTRSLPLIREEDRLVVRGDQRRDRPGLTLGRSRLTLRAGRGYNRVEGLPILFGPVIRTASRNPLRLDALAIFRTDSGLSLDDVGYWIRLEQGLGGRGRWRLGLAAYSEVQPIEDRGLSDLESSLAAGLFHRDLRDYFQNEGWSAYVEAEAPGFPATFRLTYRDEDHYSAAVGDPWTLLRRDAAWRELPLVAEGRLQAVDVSLEVDRRNNPDDPTDGWLLRAALTRGVGGAWELPGYTLHGFASVPVDPVPYPSDPTLAAVDLRRYARVDPRSDLRLRFFYAGSLTRNPLPPQFQTALGGEGSLPGHRRFSLACGARNVLATVGEDPDTRPVDPTYGCDRTVLFQGQFRQEFNFHLGTDSWNDDWDDWRWWPHVDLTVAWMLFMDAGRGWSFTPGGTDTDTLADVGAGLSLGDLGFYWAYPLTGDDQRVNFFVRLQHRF